MTPLIRMLSTYWQLSDAQAKALGRAVAKARWSVAQEWRRKVLLFDQQLVRPLSDQQAVDAVQRFLTTQAAPGAVIAVLENLVGERVLSHTDSRAIERKVLDRVDRHGQWV